jgi:uncharacterized membrane protein YgcG
VPTGEAFTESQISEIERTLVRAATETGIRFSVYIGEPREEQTRLYAEKLHSALGEEAPDAVLILVAPGRRRLEVVTGRDVKLRLGDRACGLAALSMASAFGGGDLVGGIVTGVRMLAEAAGRVPTPSS